MKLVSAIALLCLASSGLFAKFDQAPQVIKQTAVEIPRSITGPEQVNVLLYISPDGRVSAAAIDASTNHDLDDACLAALVAWRFRPAFAHGQPIAIKALQPIIVSDGKAAAPKAKLVYTD